MDRSPFRDIFRIIASCKTLRLWRESSETPCQRIFSDRYSVHRVYRARARRFTLQLKMTTTTTTTTTTKMTIVLSGIDFLEARARGRDDGKSRGESDRRKIKGTVLAYYQSGSARCGGAERSGRRRREKSGTRSCATLNPERAIFAAATVAAATAQDTSRRYRLKRPTCWRL